MSAPVDPSVYFPVLLLLITWKHPVPVTTSLLSSVAALSPYLFDGSFAPVTQEEAPSVKSSVLSK